MAVLIDVTVTSCSTVKVIDDEPKSKAKLKLWKFLAHIPITGNL